MADTEVSSVSIERAIPSENCASSDSTPLAGTNSQFNLAPPGFSPAFSPQGPTSAGFGGPAPSMRGPTTAPSQLRGPPPMGVMSRPPGPFSAGAPPPFDPNFPPPGLTSPNVHPSMMNVGMSQGNFAESNVSSQQSNAPPGTEFAGEIWVETLAADGKIYYYNARTRESAWVKPAGANVKILTQKQVEAMALAAGVQPKSTTALSATSAPAVSFASSTTDSAPGVEPIGSATDKDVNNEMQKGAEAEVENNDDIMQTEMASGDSQVPVATTATPVAAAAATMVMTSQPMMTQPPANSMAMYGMPSQQMFGMPPPFMGGMPGPGMMPPRGFLPTNGFNMPPPRFPPMAVPSGPNAVMGAAIDPNLQMKAAEWSEHRTPDGKAYYHNIKTNESVWTKPQPLKDMEEAIKNAQKPPVVVRDIILHEPKPVQSNMSEDMSENAVKQVEQAKPLVPAQPKPVDKSRPIASVPVPGTPWCVVWTGDSKMFFYNPSLRKSVWDKPDELKNRPDVDKIIKNSPNSAGEVKAIPTKKKSDDALEDEAPTKKKKREETGKVETKKEDDEKKEATNLSKPTLIDAGKEAAIEAEVKASRERAIVPLEIRMKQFRDMLAEKEVSAYCTWEKELHKIVFDPRYLLLTSKERKQVFEKYVKERAEEERQEKKIRSKERRDEFRKLLEECNLNGKSSFSDFAQKYSKDERYRNIEKMKERDSLFHDFVSDLRRKEKEERSSKRDKLKKGFTDLLKENSSLDKHSRWNEVKKTIDSDPRYKAVDSSSQREEWFKSYISSLNDDSDAETTKEREKQERIETSLREREKEVQRTLSSHLRDRDKEREHHKHGEAIQHFNALLTDLVRQSDLSWKEAKRLLRKDHRWELVDSLDRPEKEKLFHEHIDMLSKKKKEKFRELLDETSDIDLTSSWKEVRKLIKEDSRYLKFSSSDRKCEREFKEYMRDKLVEAKADFRELLKESKSITYKSKKQLEESDQHLKEITEILKNDKRYLILNVVPSETDKMLYAYMDDLDRRGPPPPPTASEPTRRNQSSSK